MKTFSWRRVIGMVELGLLATVAPSAWAVITVDVIDSYGSLTINPASGSVEYLGGLETSAYGRAGALFDYSGGTPSAALASDMPAPGGLATGSASAGLAPYAGLGMATGFIPGAVAGYDTSVGQGSTYGTFEITGITGPVSVSFSTILSGGLELSSDSYGVYGRGEAVYTLSIDGNVALGYDNLQTIGPNQDLTAPIDQMLADTMQLMGDTPYYLYEQADAETMVVNSSQSVPDSMAGPETAGCLGFCVLLLFLMRRRAGAGTMLAGGLAVILAAPARADYIGSDRPDPCPTCRKQTNRRNAGAGATSLSEGNSRQDYPVVDVHSGYGSTLPFALTYNSYNADGSKAQLDTGLGFGWTHTYNSVLFQQRGQMFRLGPDGRVTQYFQNYSSPGHYTSDTGYFETLTQQPDLSFYLTNKYQSWWHFGIVPNTPFSVGGPVYRLLQSGDRNNNVTSYSYSAGLLTTVTDPFGRTLQFSYNAGNHLTSVTDPLGRTTQFQYDAMNRMITQITDPSGKTIHYTYNSQYQATRKVDRDGRMYFYTYKSLLPFMVTDDSGEPYFSMTNPTNWSVNATNLAFNMRRSYNPSATSLTDGDGHFWRYTYDTNGYITQIVAPDGATTIWTYDPGTMQPSSMTDADGNTIQWTYDANGNRISATDALGDVTQWTYDSVFNEVTSMTDPLGRVTTWTYDGHGNQISMTDPLGQTEQWTYDANGNVLTDTDKKGNTTTCIYDGHGERTSATDPLGNTTQWSYDAVGNVISMTDPLGRAAQWTYDSLDRKIGMTNALGGVTTWTYDPTGHVLQTTDPNNDITTWQYDDRSRVIETIDDLGGATQWTYDANDNPVTSTTPNGNVSTNAYDAQNRRTEMIDPLGNTTHWTYDPQGNILTATDPNANTTRTTYDVLNRVIGSTNALGGVTAYQYSMAGSPACCSATPGSSLITRMQDPDGNITFYHYDELNRLVQVVRKNSDANDVINPTDAVTTTAYDANDNVTGVTDPNTNTTATAYDSDNRKVSMVNAAGDTTSWSYDADGNVLTTTAPNEDITTNAYDGLNRVITQDDQIGLATSNAYDPNGNRTVMTDGLGHTTHYLYDGLNRQTSMTDALGHPTTTSYDPDSNLTSTTDRNGNATRYTYDALDRRISMTDALSNTTTTGYDPAGNIISRTDANDHTTHYTYDGLNRLIVEMYPDPTPNSRTNIYDGVGNLIQRIDQNGQMTTYSYNALNYLTNRVYSPSGSIDTFTYDDGDRMLSANRNGWLDTFSYDGANRLTNTTQNGKTLTYAYNIPARIQTNTQPSGRTLTYTYDARNRLLTIQDGTTNPPMESYIYDDADRIVTRTSRNGIVSSYTYNANNWITALNHSNGTVLIAGFSYTYDNEGNKLYEQKPDHPGDSSAYAYDATYRLTNYDAGTLSGLTIPSPTLAKAWSLDPLGNWNNLISNGVPDARTFGPTSELLTDNSSNYLYDADGNLTRDNLYHYGYDEENRLIQVQRRSDLIVVGQYIYDALARRVEKIDDASGTPATTFYYYDDRQIIEEQNGGGTIAQYTYGSYVDDVLTMDRAGQSYYYAPNALYTAGAVTDSSGAAVERYSYDAYGQPAILDGSYNPQPLNSWGTPHSSITNEFLFTGRQLDEESGLYWYRARFYDDIKGRFLQRDMLDYMDGMNLYEYVSDRPSFATDPTGLKYTCCAKWKRRRTVMFEEKLIAKDDTTKCEEYFIDKIKRKLTGNRLSGGSLLPPFTLPSFAFQLGFYIGLDMECNRWHCVDKVAPIVKVTKVKCWLGGCEVKYRCPRGTLNIWLDGVDGVGLEPGYGVQTTACE